MSMNLIPFRRHHSLSHPAANSLFDDEFFRPFFDMGEMFGSSGFRVDIKDKKDHYELDAELPGVNQEQIELTCDKGILTISANMNTETREEQKDYIYSERRMAASSVPLIWRALRKRRLLPAITTAYSP